MHTQKKLLKDRKLIYDKYKKIGAGSFDHRCDATLAQVEINNL